MNNEQPSQVEVQNAKKVLGFLSDMEGISYTAVRDDIFAVKSNDLDVTCIVDVEETLVLLSVEVCNVPEENESELDNFLMTLNGQAIHGKFCKCKGKYFFRESLEFTNLDFNELEACLRWTFLMVGANVQKISNIYATGEVGEEIDLDSEELDLEDLIDAGMTVADAIAGALGTEYAEEYADPDPTAIYEQEQEDITSYSEPDTKYSASQDTSYSEPSSYDSGGSYDSGSCDCDCGSW